MLTQYKLHSCFLSLSISASNKNQSPVPMSPHGMSPVTVPVGQAVPSPVNLPVFNAPGQNFGLPPITGAGPGLWSSGPSTQQQQGFGADTWGSPGLYGAPVDQHPGAKQQQRQQSQQKQQQQQQQQQQPQRSSNIW